MDIDDAQRQIAWWRCGRQSQMQQASTEDGSAYCNVLKFKRETKNMMKIVWNKTVII